MARNILTNWWGVITAVLGVAALTLGAVGVVVGAVGVFGVVEAVAGLLSGGLIIGGLALLPRRVITGSRMIVVGTALTAVGVLMIPVAALVVIGGLWTGHLQLTDRADEPHLQPVRPQPTDITTRWYLMLVAAPILIAIGLGALAIAGDGPTATGEEDVSLIGGLLWLTWILSWFGALISTGLGIVFGIKRGVARHRTRPA